MAAPKSVTIDQLGPSTQQQMAAACTGAFITSVFMTPLDVVKVRLQAQQRTTLKKRCFIYCNGLMDHVCCCNNSPEHTQKQWYSRTIPGPINGTLDGLVKIWRHEGVKSLWAGLPPTLLVAVPNTVVYFTAYEKFRGLIRHQSGGTEPWWGPAFAGGVARLWSVTICSPIELIRTKLQATRMRYADLCMQLSREVRVSGIRSLYRGWVPTVLRDVPFSVLYWASYEHLKRMGGQQERPTVAYTMMAGSLAGGFAATVTLPLDVVKTQKQIEIGGHGPNKLVRSSTLQHLQQIHRQQGVQGLFTGLSPRLVKVMPACAIMISSYEYIKNRVR